MSKTFYFWKIRKIILKFTLASVSWFFALNCVKSGPKNILLSLFSQIRRQLFTHYLIMAEKILSKYQCNRSTNFCALNLSAGEVTNCDFAVFSLFPQPVKTRQVNIIHVKIIRLWLNRNICTLFWMKMQPNIDPNAQPDDQVSWWFKLLTRGLGTVGGIGEIEMYSVFAIWTIKIFCVSWCHYGIAWQTLLRL